MNDPDPLVEAIAAAAALGAALARFENALDRLRASDALNQVRLPKGRRPTA